MLLYLLKRLLLILPTVWLISSLVFLLSRILPGTHADVVAEAQESTMGGAGRKVNQKLYIAQLRQAGLDKPLFYFTLTNRAQPDTLYRVFPVQHQVLLQRLLNQNGNWPLVAAYYHSLQNLQAQAQLSSFGPDNFIIAGKISESLKAQNTSQLKAVLESFNAEKDAGPLVVSAIALRFAQMQQQAQPFNSLLPDVRWHGTQNQYHSWLSGLVKGNLGLSYQDQQPVLQKIKEAIGNTMVFLTMSLVLTFLFSIELSLILCRWQKGQGVVLNILYLLDSIPLFLLALLLINLLLSTGLIDLSALLGNLEDGIFRPTGLMAKLRNELQQLWLPTLCLILAGMPYITTQLYRVLQQLLSTEYIKAARAKGLSESRVLRKHAFKNALLPLITLFTGYLPVIISGAVVIEVIFVKPGSGSLLRESMYARDYPVVIGLVIFLAALKAAAHVLADTLYFAVDPRTRSHLA